jgi:4'-phosphopantetheinyl transferase
MDKNAHAMESIADIRQLPDLGEETIHIWGVHVPDVLDRLEMLHSSLCVEEQETAARFCRDSDRQSSIAARGALRALLSVYTGIPATEIEFSYSGNGKPSLVPPASSRLSKKQGRQDACNTISFNVSHSGEWVVLGFGRNRNIGVDVEKIKRAMDVRAIAARYFAPEEIKLIDTADDQHAMFFQLWARKEAYVKARGSGLFQELSGFSVPVDKGTLPEVGEKDGWIFQRLEAGSKYAAAMVTDKKSAHVPCYDFGGLKWDS